MSIFIESEMCTAQLTDPTILTENLLIALVILYNRGEADVVQEGVSEFQSGCRYSI